MKKIKNKQLSEGRNIIIAGIVMLALLFVVTAVVPMLGMLPIEKIKEEAVNVLTTPFNMGSYGGMCVYILLKNMLALAIIAFLSAPLLGLPLIIFILVNGVIMGVVLYDAVQSGVFTIVLAGGILPHGVFELTAVALALGIGYRHTRRFLKRRDRKELKPDKLSVKLFGVVIIPLLVIASVIEIWVTPVIMDKVLEIML